MALKTIKICSECQNTCKQQILEEAAIKTERENKSILVSCPKGMRFKKKKAETKVKKETKPEAKVKFETKNKKKINKKNIEESNVIEVKEEKTK